MQPLEVAHLEERRQARSVGELARESVPFLGGTMCFDARGSWANSVCGLGLEGPIAPDALRDAAAWYDERGVGGEILVASPADASVLAAAGDAGYRITSFENVLAITRDQLPTEGARWPDGVRVELIDPANVRAVEGFADVTTGAFPPRLQPDGSVLEMTDEQRSMMERVVHHPRSLCFAAYSGEEMIAVAGSELCGDGDDRMACLFGAVTVPSWRGRGMQTAMIAHRASMLTEMGARVVIVQTSPNIATERNALRYGFRQAYARAALTRPDPPLEPTDETSPHAR